MTENTSKVPTEIFSRNTLLNFKIYWALIHIYHPRGVETCQFGLRFVTFWPAPSFGGEQTTKNAEYFSVVFFCKNICHGMEFDENADKCFSTDTFVCPACCLY